MHGERKKKHPPVFADIFFLLLHFCLFHDGILTTFHQVQKMALRKMECSHHSITLCGVWLRDLWK